jgi:hypothetical protein
MMLGGLRKIMDPLQMDESVFGFAWSAAFELVGDARPFPSILQEAFE